MAGVAEVLRLLRDGGRLMVGVPSYEAYLEHMRRDHPDAEVMSEVDFFRDRQAAHYGGPGKGGMRCC